MDLTQFTAKKVFLRGRGGRDAQHRADAALYHGLLVRHGEIERTTQTIENGIVTTTRVTSGDAELVKVLQEHALGMKKRFDGGRAVRSWDPLFVELYDRRAAIDMTWELLEDGITVSLTTPEPEIAELLRRHDETLHAFVRYGFEASRHESPYRPQEHRE